MDLLRFSAHIWDHYHHHRRSFPWRDLITPYRVVVSEIMLQQTQTHRVLPKFDAFVARFPDWQTLAHAPFSEVLGLWKGLGYNRRALALHKTAEQLVFAYDSILPNDETVLLQFPGIGKATACSIVAFAFNKPVVFIETNIRTVFLDAFFKDQHDVHDKAIMPLIEATLDRKKPRDWYYALMDYGVHLKKTVGNKNQQSRHYQRQSRFVGSDRQIRGQILRELLEHKSMQKSQLPARLQQDSERVLRLVEDLCQEGMLRNKNDMLYIKE